MSELNNTKKKGKNKKKGVEDNVSEHGMSNIGSSDFHQPTKKRRRKDKNKQDDLVDGTVDGSAPTKSKRRRKKQEQQDATTTVN
jgi:hypothetical protein|mmetsp:Transcript_42353/g.55835  ORF Transcript_42353/g.55835 Transcript_42353/m.55835 type:complete len:84 (-) Transcript_42353:321-572(-)